MNKIYVASPLHGDIPGNLEKAQKYCRYTQYDGIPICPHLYFSTFLDDESSFDRHQGRSFGMELLKECNEMRVYCDEVSEGIIAEIRVARDLKIPIRFYDADGNLIEPDALLINDRIGPALRQIIEEYTRPKKVECPYYEKCKRENETKRRSPKRRFGR